MRENSPFEKDESAGGGVRELQGAEGREEGRRAGGKSSLPGSCCGGKGVSRGERRAVGGGWLCPEEREAVGLSRGTGSVGEQSPGGAGAAGSERGAQGRRTSGALRAGSGSL